MNKGIDVAKWNGVIDWKKVKADGVSFAVLKVINKKCNIEDAFMRNYAGAAGVGIPVDVYNYSYATNVDKAVSDANKVVSIIRGKKVKCVWLDVEDECQMNLGKTLIDIIVAYKGVIEGAGFRFGVYTGLYFYNALIKPFHGFINCPFWIARYPSKKAVNLEYDPPTGKKPVIIHDLWGWQYTSTGRVNGIDGNVDLDIIYNEKNETIVKDPFYSVGKNYTLQNDMYIRETPTGNKKPFLKLTVNAKSHARKDSDGNGILKKGTVVTCKGIEKVGNSIWIKIPSGCVCAVSAEGKIYIK